MLRSAAADALADLVHTVTGRRPDGLPWTAPALLFNDPAVQTALALPCPGPGEVLLHEYQALRATGTLPLDAALPVAAVPGKEVSVSFGAPPVVELRAAFRLAPAKVLAEAAPLRAHLPEDVSEEIPVSATAVQTYLHLSGDQNPIHKSQAEADRLGLPSPIAPGLLLLSLMQPFVGGTAKTVTARFIAPVAVGAALRVGVQRRSEGRQRAMLLQNGAAHLVVDVQAMPELPSATS